MSRSRLLRSRIPLLVATTALLLGSCSDGGDETVETGTTGSTAAGSPEPASDTTDLCDQWAAVYDGQDEGLNDQFFAELQRVAPDSLADDVSVMVEFDRLEREARGGGGDEEVPDLEGDALMAASRVMAWVQTRCAGGARVAPPLDALPTGLEVCAANALPVGLAEEVIDGDLVIYAPDDAEDPFAGEALGLMWGVSGHRGDGDTTAITLRAEQGATNAVVGPITVFQQVVLPDLGTVVAWTEGGVEVGLYGRGWPADRADELVAIAEQIQVAEADGDEDGKVQFSIPDDALPDGFGEAVRGPAEAAAAMGIGAYSVSYRPAGEGGGTSVPPDADDDPTGRSLVQLNGSPSEPGTEELWRMFVLDSERIQVGDRTVAVADDAWGEDGPVMASWRHGDGHVTITGMNVDREVVLELVETSRELTDDEWVELSALNTFC